MSLDQRRVKQGNENTGQLRGRLFQRSTFTSAVLHRPRGPEPQESTYENIIHLLSTYQLGYEHLLEMMKLDNLVDVDVVEGLRIALNQVNKFIRNKTRWRILSQLRDNGQVTWTELRDEHGINPNMINHHTKALIDTGLIEKSNPGFVLTNAGKAIMTLSLREMMEIVEIGAEAHRRRNDQEKGGT